MKINKLEVTRAALRGIVSGIAEKLETPFDALEARYMLQNVMQLLKNLCTDERLDETYFAAREAMLNEQMRGASNAETDANT